METKRKQLKDFSSKLLKRIEHKLYHQDTNFLLNYLTLYVKDDNITKEIDNER